MNNNNEYVTASGVQSDVCCENNGVDCNCHIDIEENKMTYIWNHETQEKVNRLLVVSAFNGKTINREDTFVNGEGEHKESLFYVLKFSSEKPSVEWSSLCNILQDYDQTGWIHSNINKQDGFTYSIELSFYVCPKTKQIGH